MMSLFAARRRAVAMGGASTEPRAGKRWFPKVADDAWKLPNGLEKKVMSPALVVDLAKVRENVQRIMLLLGPTWACDWRPHLKTTKMSCVWAELLKMGMTQFKVATTKEAALLTETITEYVEEILNGKHPDVDDELDYIPLGSERAKRKYHLLKEFGYDILVAYPLVGPSLDRLADLATMNGEIQYAVLVEAPVDLDDPDVPSTLKRGFENNLGYFVDVNPGMHRTGMPIQKYDEKSTTVGGKMVRDYDLDDRNEHVYRAAASVKSGFRGFHFYEGHVSDCADFAGATDADREVALTKRKEACHALYREYLIPLLRYVVSRAEVESGGERLWFDRCEVVTSGTPAFMAAFDFHFNGAFSRVHDAGFARAIERNVFIHTVSPGTVVFHDWRGERQNPNLGLVPAAVVMSRVVSLPAPGRITLDCGSKALACEAGDPAGYVLGKPEWEALACSEEHLPCVVRMDDDATVAGPKRRKTSNASTTIARRGDVVFVVPEHICPTVNLATHAIVLDGGRFVGVKEVGARGHEVMVDRGEVFGGISIQPERRSMVGNDGESDDT